MARSGQPTDPHPALRATFSQREKEDDQPAILIPDGFLHPFNAFAPGSVNRPTLRPNRRMMAGFHPPSPPARFRPASDPRLDELDSFFRATV